MRLQAMVHGGPFNETIFTHNVIGNEVPPELLLASLSDEIDNEDKVTGHLYRLVDSERHVGARTTFVSYSYLGPKETFFGLVNQWIVRGAEG